MFRNNVSFAWFRGRYDLPILPNLDSTCGALNCEAGIAPCLEYDCESFPWMDELVCC